MEQTKLKRGRPRKIIGSIPDKDTTFALEGDKEQAEVSDTSTKSDIPAKPNETSDAKAKKLQFKYDNIDKIREQQNARYEKIKGELALRRLMNTVFSDKYTNDQRLQLLKELNNKLNIN